MRIFYRVKRAFSILGAIIMAICCVQVSAFGADEGISIQYAAAGAEFKLYRIGSFSSKGLIFEGDFAKYSETTVNEELAGTLAGYIARDGISATAIVTTNSDKKAVVKGIKAGCYVITGSKTTVGKMTYKPTPALINYTGEFLEVTAKYESEKEPDEPDTKKTSRSVIKQWVNVPETVVHPEYITAQLLKNGKLYDEVQLSDDNSWKYEWTELDAGYEWVVIEKQVPYHYTGGVTQDGNLFVITNKYQPVVPSGGGGGGNTPTPEPTTEAETERDTVTEVTTGSSEGTTEGQPEGTTEGQPEGTTDSNEETPTEATPNEEIPPSDSDDTPPGENGETPDGETPNGESDTPGSDAPSDDESSYNRNRDRYYYDKDGNPITEEEWLEEQARERQRLLADKLPQTGLLWWPVPIMAGVGILFIIIGMLRRDNENRKKS